MDVQSDLYFPRLYYPWNSIIRSFWGQNLVRPTYMKCSKSLTVLHIRWAYQILAPKSSKTSINHTSRFLRPKFSAPKYCG